MSNSEFKARFFLIALPLLSLALGLVAWLVYGVDIPYMDDWRPYILGEAGSFSPSILLRPSNDTLYPIGVALDSAALRWLGGNSVAYQALSMLLVLGSLLALQWLLLRRVFRDPTVFAAAFLTTLLMLQPGGYWGEQNMAFHQAIPLICILLSLYLTVVMPLRIHWAVLLVFCLGAISGMTYISGAFAFLTCGMALFAQSFLWPQSQARARQLWGGASMVVSGLLTSAPQAWVLLVFQKGTHRADAPLALPTEADFWFYLFGKIGRSLLLPASHPVLSLTLSVIALVLLAMVLWMALRRSVKAHKANTEEVAYAEGLAITLSLAAAVATYLLMVAAGRANLRDPGMSNGLEIFSFGYLRFHYFWATLLWPWLVGFLLVYWSDLRRGNGRGRGTMWLALACSVIYFSYGGAFDHMSRQREMSGKRVEGINCLRKAGESMRPMICPSIEPRDLRPALEEAERVGASFTRYLRSEVESSTPADTTQSGVLLLPPGSFIDGNFKASSGGQVTSVGVLVGTFGGKSDGALEVSLCNAKKCATGRVQLAEVLDNAYSEVRLPQPIPASEAAPMLFRIRLVASSHPVALWTHPPVAESANILRLQNGASIDTTHAAETISLRIWTRR